MAISSGGPSTLPGGVSSSSSSRVASPSSSRAAIRIAWRISSRSRIAWRVPWTSFNSRLASGRPSTTTAWASPAWPTRRITSGVRVSALSGATETVRIRAGAAGGWRRGRPDCIGTVARHSGPITWSEPLVADERIERRTRNADRGDRQDHHQRGSPGTRRCEPLGSSFVFGSEGLPEAGSFFSMGIMLKASSGWES